MQMPEQRKFLLIKTRNLGDAVIGTALVETIAQAFPSSGIDVLTRPEMAKMFTCNPHVRRVFSGRFPMGSVHDFGWSEALHLLGLVRLLRREQYTDVANTAGDFREEILGRLITPNNNWSPDWAPGHPCRQVNRTSAIPIANRPVPIPCSVPNVHEAVALMGRSITRLETAQKPALYRPDQQKLTWKPLENAVGFHPLASQPWRCWDLDKWVTLARELIGCGMQVYVFGSPAEAQELHQYFGAFDPHTVRIVTGDLATYFSTVSQMRVFLCPDSFAAHVAYALDVPTILLNGANDAKTWAPPGTVVLAAGPELPCYPCYNRPTCIGSAQEFACVRRIPTTSVFDTVQTILARSPFGLQPTSCSSL